MRKILDEKDPEGRDERERIFRHQVEVARSWDVIIVGKNGDGELLKVASGRDSTKAAEFVLGLVGIKPIDKEAARLVLAEHFRKVESDRFTFALQILGERIKAMADDEKQSFFNGLQTNASGFVEMAEKFMAEAEGKADDGRRELTAGEGEHPATANPDDQGESAP